MECNNNDGEKDTALTVDGEDFAAHQNQIGAATATANNNSNSNNGLDYRQLGILMIELICMGAALGFERSLLPRMAVEVWGITSSGTVLNLVSTFGASKAVANVFAGQLADRFGRKPTLIVGFMVALPIMPCVIYAESWTQIIAMNILFGISQGLLGSALFFLLIDVFGPHRRGIAVGLGECTIYVSTALLNFIAGNLASRFGYRPVPFWVATMFAIVGFISTGPLRDTLDQVLAEEEKTEQKNTINSFDDDDDKANGMSENESTPLITATHELYSRSESDLESDEKKLVDWDEVEHNVKTLCPSAFHVLAQLLWNNPNFPLLCIAGMTMNFKDGFAWGTFPIFFSQYHQLSDRHTDMLVAIYPLCWGVAQAFTGALSDVYGRKLFFLFGFCACTVATFLFFIPGFLCGRPATDNPRHFYIWILADVCLGLGTAMAYPALQAAVADEVEPVYRGEALGFYRFLRDMGYVVGALVCGSLTDILGYPATFLIVSGVLGVSSTCLWLFYKTPPVNGTPKETK